jgi:hypothetical protein
VAARAVFAWRQPCEPRGCANTSLSKSPRKDRRHWPQDAPHDTRSVLLPARAMPASQPAVAKTSHYLANSRRRASTATAFMAPAMEMTTVRLPH